MNTWAGGRGAIRWNHFRTMLVPHRCVRDEQKRLTSRRGREGRAWEVRRGEEAQTAARRGGRENERRVNRMIENRQRNQDVSQSTFFERFSPARFCFPRCFPFLSVGAACLCVHIVNTSLPSLLSLSSPFPLTRPTVTNLCSNCTPYTPLPVALFVSFPTSFLYSALASLSVSPLPPCLMHNVSLSVAFVSAKNGISHRATSSNCKRRSGGFLPRRCPSSLTRRTARAAWKPSVRRFYS